MRSAVEIENIEAMRQLEGIDDFELRHEIRGLVVGDFVKMTFFSRNRPSTCETLTVRIVKISRAVYHGELVSRPASAALSPIGLEAPLTFTADHIHSVIKKAALIA